MRTFWMIDVILLSSAISTCPVSGIFIKEKKKGTHMAWYNYVALQSKRTVQENTYS